MGLTRVGWVGGGYMWILHERYERTWALVKLVILQVDSGSFQILFVFFVAVPFWEEPPFGSCQSASKGSSDPFLRLTHF